MICEHAATPTAEVTSTTDPMFTLKCTTTGAPAVVSWSYSNTLRMYTNDGEHQLSQSLLNGATSTFESRLAFTSHPFPSDTGGRMCIAAATYISANSSETDMSTAVGKQILQHYLLAWYHSYSITYFHIQVKLTLLCILLEKESI